MIAALGGLLFGYDTAVISGAVECDRCQLHHSASVCLKPRAHSLSGWTISCALLGCVIGGAMAGPLSQRIGRRGGLLVAASLFFVSSLGSAFPEFGLAPIGSMGPSALHPFIVYRISAGVGVGLASMLSPLYIAEIAPPAQRGRLVTYQQIAIVWRHGGGVLRELGDCGARRRRLGAVDGLAIHARVLCGTRGSVPAVCFSSFRKHRAGW